ncbi:MAG: hypothetical protein RL660_302 [Bacteroidota bacterium]
MRQGKVLYEQDIEDLETYLHEKHCIIVVDENTHRHCLPIFLKTLPSLAAAFVVTLKVGESCKSLAQYQYLLEKLVDAKANKQTVLIALGGGSICDVAAFAASTYMRGIPLVLLPTSYLAMVDAAHGGKTAINFGETKNLVGSFYPADITFVEPNFTSTQSDRDFNAGIAELLKQALLQGEERWQAVCACATRADYCAQLPSAINYKRQLVDQDPYDNAVRQTLNLGHTIGHALEAYYLQTDTPLLHGEAVAFGLIAELFVAEHLLGTAEKIRIELSKQVEKLFDSSVLRRPAATQALLDLMLLDKKSNASIRMSLLQHYGDCKIKVEVPVQLATEAVQNLFSQYAS